MNKNSTISVKYLSLNIHSYKYENGSLSGNI